MMIGFSGMRWVPRVRDQVPRDDRRQGRQGQGGRPRRLRELQTRLPQVALQVSTVEIV